MCVLIITNDQNINIYLKFQIYDILVTINRRFEDQNWKYNFFSSLLLADFKNKIENIDFVDYHHSTHVLTKNINTVIIMCFYHRYIVNLLENYFKSSIIFAIFHKKKHTNLNIPLYNTIQLQKKIRPRYAYLLHQFHSIIRLKRGKVDWSGSFAHVCGNIIFFTTEGSTVVKQYGLNKFGQ